jgi:hypothetical protein
MELRCGGQRAGRPCRTLLGRVFSDGDAWWIEINDVPRDRVDLPALFDPGRWELHPSAEYAAWCPKHRRQVMLDGRALIDAATRGERELLLSPHRVRRFAEIDYPDVDLTEYESDPDE